MRNKPKLKSWSFSALMVYESCPYRSFLERIERIPNEQPMTAADRGTQIHQEAEDYVRGKAPLTHNLRYFTTDLTSLQRHFEQGRVFCEEEWGFDRNWNVVDWSKAWLRLKLDAGCYIEPTHLAVIDYKTGKRFGNEIKHAEQLQLYSTCSLIRYPKIQLVTSELWYLDQNELASFKMKPTQLSKYLAHFDRRGRRMTEDTEYKPNPNIHSCKYCPYAPHKQNQCRYGVAPDNATAPKEALLNFHIDVKAPSTKLELKMADDAARLAAMMEYE